MHEERVGAPLPIAARTLGRGVWSMQWDWVPDWETLDERERSVSIDVEIRQN